MKLYVVLFSLNPVPARSRRPLIPFFPYPRSLPAFISLLATGINFDRLYLWDQNSYTQKSYRS